ncbi:WYL domain-containing protein [soil metagenome]
MRDDSPTARALLTLALLSARPGISAARLAERLGVSDRSARRYVAILREAGVPVESIRGPYGGYRVGRGLRLPPLMFTTAEALALVMAVLEARRGAPDADDPVADALGKITRVLPEPVARTAAAVREMGARGRAPAPAAPDPDVTAALVQAGAEGRRVLIDYRRERGGRVGDEREIEVDPWVVVVRHHRWYLLCWSHASDAQRAYRVDRVTRVRPTHGSFDPPDLEDPQQALADHLAQGWRLQVEVVLDVRLSDLPPWFGRNLGRLEATDDDRTRLLGSTYDAEWYVEKLADLRVPFRVVAPPELRAAARERGRRLIEAGAEEPPVG